jgi:glycosyltransferase involved in cell wall biosynthesis
VITTKNGCFPEAAGPDSVFIDPNSVEEIRNEIVRLFNNPEERKKIAEKGHAYVQQFNDQNVAENLMRAYKKII